MFVVFEQFEHIHVQEAELWVLPYKEHLCPFRSEYFENEHAQLVQAPKQMAETEPTVEVGPVSVAEQVFVTGDEPKTEAVVGFQCVSEMIKELIKSHSYENEADRGSKSSSSNIRDLLILH